MITSINPDRAYMHHILPIRMFTTDASSEVALPFHAPGVIAGVSASTSGSYRFLLPYAGYLYNLGWRQNDGSLNASWSIDYVADKVDADGAFSGTGLRAASFSAGTITADTLKEVFSISDWADDNTAVQEFLQKNVYCLNYTASASDDIRIQGALVFKLLLNDEKLA